MSYNCKYIVKMFAVNTSLRQSARVYYYLHYPVLSSVRGGVILRKALYYWVGSLSPRIFHLFLCHGSDAIQMGNIASRAVF